MKALHSVGFNRTCLNNNLLPKYTNFRLYDPALQQSDMAYEFRRNLVHEEINAKETRITQLEEELSSTWRSLAAAATGEVMLEIKHTLDSDIAREGQLNRTLLTNKLNRLYHAQLPLLEAKDKFVNLSKHELTQDQKHVLNLGPNCHIQGKFDSTTKKMELELLYRSTCQLEKDKKIQISEGFSDALKNEGNKNRSTRRKSILSMNLKNAIKELKNNEEIVIRRADKSCNYVILDKQAYKEKLDRILDDDSKFERIRSDPTKQLKVKLNKLITACNSVVDHVHFPKLEGDFSPGYIYGNVKVHKNQSDPPLTPIISQVTTPTYPIAKKINQIIQPYLSTRYSIKSTDELLSILQTAQPEGILASLDVENLFTNVPIDRTIDIILDQVYRNSSEPPPRLPEDTLKSLLLICTKEAPFRHIDGTLFRQKDGIAMGSPLGPIFANFYMANLEKNVLSENEIRPNLYLRYVDDIFVVTKDLEQLESLRCKLENNSVLKFTHEIGHNKLPFLDVDIETKNGKFETKVHTKTTNAGECLNYLSECPNKYKSGVIFSLINRAYKVSSNQQALDNEIKRLKQLFTNNNYPMKFVNEQISKFLNKKTKSPQENTTTTNVPLFYMNQMNANHAIDERVLNNIIQDKVKCTTPNEKLSINIYYKTPTMKDLLIRNNVATPRDALKMSNVVYRFKCPVEGCTLPNPSYIGSTQCTLANRITNHVQDGSFRNHLINDHQISPNRNIYTENVTIIKKLPDKSRLFVYEALYIKTTKPSINTQTENMSGMLKLFNDAPSNEVRYIRTLPDHLNYSPTRLQDHLITSQQPQHSYNLRNRP
jgi:hypothetical protein